jgi:hypothetical protein
MQYLFLQHTPLFFKIKVSLKSGEARFRFFSNIIVLTVKIGLLYDA